MRFLWELAKLNCLIVYTAFLYGVERLFKA